MSGTPCGLRKPRATRAVSAIPLDLGGDRRRRPRVDLTVEADDQLAAGHGHHHGLARTLSASTGARSVQRRSATPTTPGARLSSARPPMLIGSDRSTAHPPATKTGAKVAVVVTAANGAGSGQSSSSQVGPVVAAGPSAAQIKVALARSLAVSGKAARIAQLLEHGGYSASFTAPSPGRVVISWSAPCRRARIMQRPSSGRCWSRPRA